MAFNRNIITKPDAENFDDPTQGTPRTFTDKPPASVAGGEKTESDDFTTQLLKFAPVEIIGFYTLASSVIVAQVDDRAWTSRRGCSVCSSVA